MGRGVRMGRRGLWLVRRLRRRAASGAPGAPRWAGELAVGLALLLVALALARAPGAWAAAAREEVAAVIRLDTAPGWGRSLRAWADEAGRALGFVRGEARPVEGMAAPSDALPTGLGRLAWPVVGAVVSGFGFRDGPDGPEYHEGLDLAGEDGAPVRAVAAGQVASVSRDARGIGLVVTVAHAYGWTSVYGHLARAVVAVGREVEAGEVIGYLAPGGDDGRARGAVLHFEMREDGKPLDPAPYLGLFAAPGP